MKAVADHAGPDAGAAGLSRLGRTPSTATSRSTAANAGRPAGAPLLHWNIIGIAAADTMRRSERQDRLSKLSRHPSIPDLSRAARRRLPPFVYDFLEGGTGRETALARDRESLDKVLFIPRSFTDVSHCDPGVELFGRRYAWPIGVSPVGFGNLVWPNADTILAAAAAKAEVPYILSTVATTSLERIAEVAGGCGWFQLYPSRERPITDDLIRRAKAAGYGVLVITIDAPVPAIRERMIRTGDSVRLQASPGAMFQCLKHPRWSVQLLRHGRPDLPNIRPYLDRFPALKNDVHRYGSTMTMPGVTGEEVRRIRDLWPGALVLKGVLSGEAASEAVEAGADAVMVSNHGGRQFDAGPAAADALREVAAEIRGRRPILFDGGVRSGLDVLRAKALGAAMAFSGRSFLYGVAAFGEAGVAQVLRIFTSDITRGLKQLGCPRFQELDRRWVSSSSGGRAFR